MTTSLRVALFLALAACASDPQTEVVVTIEPTPSVLQRAASVAVVVTQEQGGQKLFERESVPWTNGKLTLVIAPDDDRTAVPYRFEVKATDDDQPFAVARLLSGYVLGETRFVSLSLDDSCNPPCPDPGQTCVASACVSARVDSVDLGTDLGSAARPGAARTPAPDAGAI